MSAATDTRNSSLTREASVALGARVGDSKGVRTIRDNAAAALETLNMPTKSERPWKYYDPAQIELDDYTPGEGEIEITVPPIDGLSATIFDAKAAAITAVVDRHLASAVSPARNRIVAAHYAYLSGGVLVHAAANVEAREAVRITRSYSEEGLLAAPHTLIVTGANSRINVIEDCRSTGDDMVILPVVEIVPGPGSEVRYSVLHRWGAQTRVFAEQRTISEKDASVISLSLAVGGEVLKSHIESSLVARGSSSELYGLCVGAAAEHSDFYTIQDHIGPDTRSDLLFKSALKGESRAVYYGLTRVGLGAKNADANQENRNLLLSRQAKADSDPVLEILTNDVIRVSHGATAGPVDEESLYYLQTRGISRDDAEALLVRGFLGQVLDRLPDEALRDEIAAAIDEKLSS